MINRPALDHLRKFIEKRDKFSYSFLIGIPAVFRVLEYEFALNGQVTEETINLCKWLYSRAELVRRLLLVHETEEADPSIEQMQSNWTKVC